MVVQANGEVVEGKKRKCFSVFSFNIHNAGNRDTLRGVTGLANDLEECVFPYMDLFFSRGGHAALQCFGLIANNTNLLN